MTLTKTFQQFATLQDKADDLAGGILKNIKAQRIETLDAFNEAVSQAYAENGWNTTMGRPKVDTPITPAPRVLRQYISECRAAFRLELPVKNYMSWTALRSAIREARQKEREDHPVGSEKPEELKWVQVQAEGKLVGSLWHDAIVVWERLPENEQQAFERSLDRLLKKYRPTVRDSLAA